MINVSNSFKRKLYNEERDYTCEAIITLADNTVLTIGNEDIMADGLDIEDAVADDDNFNAVGATIINAATLILYNNDEVYSDYDFTNARVEISISLEVEAIVNDELVIIPEEIKKGTFTVDEASYGSSTITLTMLDDMEQFDRPYSLSSLVYPATLKDIVTDACSICNVPLAPTSANFPNYTYTIAERPSDDNTTFRDVIGYVATIAGCFARCDVEGKLEFKWFNTSAIENTSNDLDGGTLNPWTAGSITDGGTLNPWTAGSTIDEGEFTDKPVPHYITDLYSQNLSVDDVVITGVKIFVEVATDEGTDTQVFSNGTDDYCIIIENNPFITVDNANSILTYLANQLIGLRFRKCEITHANDPSIEAGDVGFVWDTKGVEHPILITRVTFSPKKPQTIVCGAETPSRNNATRFSSQTKAFVDARKVLRKQKDSYQSAMDELREDVENANGLYYTEEVQADQSVKYYLHEKPNLSESDIRIEFSTTGITVTPDRGQHVYGLRVDGQFLASVIQTIDLFFDYASGGTLVLGGSNNNSGTLSVRASNNFEVAKITNAGASFYAYNSKTDTTRAYLVLAAPYQGIGNFYWAIYGDAIGTDTNHILSFTQQSSTPRHDGSSGSDVGYGISLASGSDKKYIPDYFFIPGYTYYTASNSSSSFIRNRYRILLGSTGVGCFIGASSYVSGDLEVSGTITAQTIVATVTKPRLVKTDNYNDRLLYCYETPTPMFGDIGEGETDDSGICIIALDDIFSETIALKTEYQVFLQKEGQGDIWVEEKTQTHFTVKGTANLRFAWEIKAKQRDVENLRLEQSNIYNYETEVKTPEDMYEDELEQLIREQEEILYETA